MTQDKRTKLINRITSNEASREDVAAFAAHASTDRSAWEDLARSLHDELQLRATLQAEFDRAAATSEIQRALARQQDQGAGASIALRPRVAAALGTWTGWATAAVLMLAWVVSSAVRPAADLMPSEQTGVRLVADSADAALDRYLELGHSEGRIITELPTIMIETERGADGGLVIYYVRQLLERESVGQAYEYAEDELGQPAPVRIDLTSFVPETSSL